MTATENENLVSAILVRQIGHCVEWKEPQTPPLLGSRYLEDVAAARDYLSSAIATQRTILLIRDHEELVAEYDETGRTSDAAVQTYWRNVREDMRDFFKKSPVILAGLGHPDYWPDYAYWSRMEHFKIKEVMWLSVGLEPRFEWDRKLMRSEKKGDYISAYLKIADDLLMQIERFTKSEMLNKEMLDARRIHDWITHTKFPAQFEFKDVLKRVAERRGGKASDNTPEKPTDKRELAAAQKIIAAMAIDGYGYHPASQRSPIPGQIEAACDEVGLPVSRETVLKHLRAGTKHLPED